MLTTRTSRMWRNIRWKTGRNRRDDKMNNYMYERRVSDHKRKLYPRRMRLQGRKLKNWYDLKEIENGSN